MGAMPSQARAQCVCMAPCVRMIGPLFTGDLTGEEGRALVDRCHERYCQALLDLYDRYKDVYAPDRKRDMRLVE